MNDKIKDEIYEFVSKLDLTEEEMQHIDIYVKDLLEYLTPLLVSQENVLNNDKDFAVFKEKILKQLGE